MEETNAAPNRMIIILLGLIVLLLAAIVAYFVFANGNSNSAATNTDTGAVTPPAGMGAAPVEFDPATATRVADGETPEQHVTAYFEAVLAKNYAEAYNRLPADKKAAQDEASFGQQLESYGVAGYTIDSVVEEGEQAEITATASMSGGEFQYLWTFVKDGDSWLVKSRTLPGMGQ